MVYMHHAYACNISGWHSMRILHCSANCEPCDHDHRYPRYQGNLLARPPSQDSCQSKNWCASPLGWIETVQVFLQFQVQSASSQSKRNFLHRASAIGVHRGAASSLVLDVRVRKFGVSVANSIIQGSTPETMGRIATVWITTRFLGAFHFTTLTNYWQVSQNEKTHYHQNQAKHMDVLQSITGNETGHERKRWEPFQVWYAPDASASSIFVPFFASALSGADGKQPALQFMSWPVVMLFR